MHKAQKQVQEFSEIANITVNNVPVVPNYQEFRKRFKLIAEEFHELLEASYEYELYKIIDGMCDTIYVIYGLATLIGIDLEPFFDEIHKTNMAKITLHCAYNEDGKLLKPKNWQPPDLERIFNEYYGHNRTVT